MSNWTPRQAFSELMSKFRRSGSDESSSYSLDQADVEPHDIVEDEDAPVSPLALMNEGSPEAWLGQFLLMLELGGVTRYGTITGAKRDTDLQVRLLSLKEQASQENPLVLIDGAAAEELKARDWAAWWRVQSALTRYCYSALALSMLGDISHVDDLEAMYRQSANSRIQRDSHFVLCYLLGREWPGYNVTSSDIERLRDQQQVEGAS